ncbi:DinB family protein [Kitasatospora sp. NPDC096147]|uniref:DinB family protein n=1 Tax=Kitasatospora sp. NPDC096147 TaxID=3364093 RepID=UPI003804D0D3
MSDHLPEPSTQLSDPTELLLGYLDYYRSAIDAKLAGLPEAELRTSRLPSDWSALELLKHLGHMERRWLHWAFLGEPVPAPWGDRGHDRQSPDGRWQVGPDDTLAELLAALHAGGADTREVVTGTPLATPASPGGRFADDGSPLPTLGWILFHVLQEYARHAGHLDIVLELTDGRTGE